VDTSPATRVFCTLTIYGTSVSHSYVKVSVKKSQKTQADAEACQGTAMYGATCVSASRAMCEIRIM